MLFNNVKRGHDPNYKYVFSVDNTVKLKIIH
jgi:hypothetical protein